MKPAPVVLSVFALAALSGCVERRIEITSEPPGALVWLNDQQLGRTPTQASFLYHGVYDVRLQLDGYETLQTTGDADAPFYENAPLDLAAEALPFRIDNIQRWHYVLTPKLEATESKEALEAGLLERAGAMRAQLDAIPQPEEYRKDPGGEPPPPDPADGGSGQRGG
ncbi:MAG: PEGA domain-containing protein [Phycisphaerales bacterium]|nr:PEGA domain-containing protein [Phycisphaerales bacterium]